MHPDEYRQAHETLMNWGRANRDDWLQNHILIDPPPTSAGYIAPNTAYDEPEPPRMPIDELDAKISEHVIVSLAFEAGGIDRHRALVRWYTRLIFRDMPQDERYANLSRFLHCSNESAPKILDDARAVFWNRKRTMDALAHLIKIA